MLRALYINKLLKRTNKSNKINVKSITIPKFHKKNVESILKNALNNNNYNKMCFYLCCCYGYNNLQLGIYLPWGRWGSVQN